MPLRPTRAPARLLNLHSGLVMVSAQFAGNFFAVYLLKIGLGLAATFLALAAVLILRFLLRFLVLWLVPRLGLRRSLALGTAIRALQFLPLAHADHTAGLLGWIALSALADALYWPLYHAVVVAVGTNAERGRQVGTLESIRSLAGIIGPALGGWLMASAGPVASFALGAAVQLAALWPLLAMAEVAAGPVPAPRRSLEGDLLGFLIFVGDGLVQSGWSFVWPLALFLTLNSSFASYGGALALSGLVAAILAAAAGRVLDLGHGARLLRLVTVLMALGLGARILALGNETASVLVNAFSVIAISLYTPLLMNTMYNRAQRLGPLRFHFFAEAGWDTGCILGCMLAATVAWAGASLGYALLPAFLGLALMRQGIIWAERQVPLPPVEAAVAAVVPP